MMQPTCAAKPILPTESSFNLNKKRLGWVDSSECAKHEALVRLSRFPTDAPPSSGLNAIILSPFKTHLTRTIPLFPPLRLRRVAP